MAVNTLGAFKTFVLGNRVHGLSRLAHPRPIVCRLGPPDDEGDRHDADSRRNKGLRPTPVAVRPLNAAQ